MVYNAVCWSLYVDLVANLNVLAMAYNAVCWSLYVDLVANLNIQSEPEELGPSKETTGI
jgi:hypothetical protein